MAIKWNLGMTENSTRLAEIQWEERFWDDPSTIAWHIRSVIEGIAHQRGVVKIKCSSLGFLLELWTALSKKTQYHDYACVAVFDHAQQGFVVSYTRSAAYAKGKVL